MSAPIPVLFILAPVPVSYAVIGVPAGLAGLWAGWRGFHQGTWGVERRRGFPGVCAFVAMVFGPGVAVVTLTGALSQTVENDVGLPVGIAALVVCGLYNIMYFAGLVPEWLLPRLQRETPRRPARLRVDPGGGTRAPAAPHWDRSRDGDLPDEDV